MNVHLVIPMLAEHGPYYVECTCRAIGCFEHWKYTNWLPKDNVTNGFQIWLKFVLFTIVKECQFYDIDFIFKSIVLIYALHAEHASMLFLCYWIVGYNMPFLQRCSLLATKYQRGFFCFWSKRALHKKWSFWQCHNHGDHFQFQ